MKYRVFTYMKEMALHSCIIEAGEARTAEEDPEFNGLDRWFIDGRGLAEWTEHGTVDVVGRAADMLALVMNEV